MLATTPVIQGAFAIPPGDGRVVPMHVLYLFILFQLVSQVSQELSGTHRRTSECNLCSGGERGFHEGCWWKYISSLDLVQTTSSTDQQILSFALLLHSHARCLEREPPCLKASRIVKMC